MADEDALRRDGLAAVLSGNNTFEVVLGVADGEAALAEIRELRPDVAVIDLNLPKLHGIELVRILRSESLPTKVVIMAGTDDDEIVREVVRAGGDAYLLKNGPSRHLIDAINYVRDGGQYFSPQLRRDGRDRHLLEEPRPPTHEAVRHADEDDEQVRDEAPRRRPVKSRRSEPLSFKQRLREESPSQNLNDRDYEIMSMMADGIRPILDRLDEIDSRVGMMEAGDVETPGDPRAWLSAELVRTLGGKASRDVGMMTRTVDDLEARLPHLIEEAVTKRFSQMAGKLQQGIEETHVRTMEAFVKTIQAKLVQRVTALESDMISQADAMNQLREYSQRTEENLSRLISGVDKLAQELPRRLAAAIPLAAGSSDVEGVLPSAPRAVKRHRLFGSGSVSGRKLKIGAASAIGLLVLGLVGWGIVLLTVDESGSDTTPTASTESGADDKPKKTSTAPGVVDTKNKLQAAQDAMDRREYAVAEDVYRTVLKAEPNNVDAIKGLASVLFREDKTDEAAALLDKLPKD